MTTGRINQVAISYVLTPRKADSGGARELPHISVVLGRYTIAIPIPITITNPRVFHRHRRHARTHIHGASASVPPCFNFRSDAGRPHRLRRWEPITRHTVESAPTRNKDARRGVSLRPAKIHVPNPTAVSTRNNDSVWAGAQAHRMKCRPDENLASRTTAVRYTAASSVRVINKLDRHQHQPHTTLHALGRCGRGRRRQ